MKCLYVFISLVFMAEAVFNKDYYTAAVFEHRTRGLHDPSLSAREGLEINLNLYNKAAALAKENGADIIVYNEFGLFVSPDPSPTRASMLKFAETVPDPYEGIKINPCDEQNSNAPTLTRLSCIARELKIYLVANLPSFEKCNPQCDSTEMICGDRCPEDGVFIYNTDVAYDRDGNLIAKYLKIHPYFEYVNTPHKDIHNRNTVFDTDFGRFGLVVCFDSLWKEASHLAKDDSIDALLFPTYWYDKISILQAQEWQQAWALAHNVTFLGAGEQLAADGSLGSGIFSKDSGAYVYTYENDGNSKLLLANIRIKGNSEIPKINTITVIRENSTFEKVETGDSFPENCLVAAVGPAKRDTDYRCFKNKLENYTLTALKNADGEVEACNDKFCCSLKYSTDGIKDAFYLGAFNGFATDGGFYFWKEQTCILSRCDPFDGKDCGMMPSDSHTVFKSLELSAKFNADDIYATVTNDKYRLAPKSEWNYETVNSETRLQFETKSNVPLLKVVLLGRNYSEDPPFVPFF